MSHSREYLEALAEVLSEHVGKDTLEDAKAKARSKAGGRSYPRQAPDTSRWTDERLGKLSRSELEKLQEQVTALIAQIPDDLEKQEDDCGAEPSPDFGDDWIQWKTCILIHEGFEQGQAFAIANDMAERQIKDLSEKSINSIFVKADAERGLVYSINLIPDTADLQGDVVSKREIEDAAHNHMIKHRRSALEHQEELRGALLVESYIAPHDMTLNGSGFDVRVKAGTWITVDRVLDKDVLEAIKRGVEENAREFTST